MVGWSRPIFNSLYSRLKGNKFENKRKYGADESLMTFLQSVIFLRKRKKIVYIYIYIALGLILYNGLMVYFTLKYLLHPRHDMDTANVCRGLRALTKTAAVFKLSVEAVHQKTKRSS